MQLLSLVFGESKRERAINFVKKRFWLVSFMAMLIVITAFFAVFSDEVVAKIFYASGYYTKVCGDNINPNGSLDGNVFRPADACRNKCDLNAGTCSSNTVYRFECDGKTTDCRSNAQGPAASQSLNRSGLCGKTVQIDAFKRNCLASGDCNTLPSWDPNADLEDFIVWYAGDCAAATPTPTPGGVVCNDSSVSLSANPSSANAGSPINFRISGDASTFVNDNYGGGAVNCTGDWTVGGPGVTCAATQSGNYTWTHNWKHCEGSFSNCSNTCTKSINFSVAGGPTPTPTPTPVPVCNDSSVSLSVNPSSANTGSSMNFRISGDASTWVDDNYGGGAVNCTGDWTVNGPGKTCTANQPGNYTWTHNWKHCEGNTNNCSNTCTKSASFSVSSIPTPPPTPTPTPVPVCNDSSVSLSVNPSSVNPRQPINFRISGDASTWVSDDFGGGADLSCTGDWTVGGPGLTCNAGSAPGNYTWTHRWKHCEGSTSNCSNTCTKTASFNVQAPPPTVDIKADGSDGPVTIPYNSSANLSWTSVNANTCVASNGWTGTKATSGMESTGNLTNAKTYTITCTGPGGSANDSVTVNVQAPTPPTVDIKANNSDGPITIQNNTSAILSWSSSNANTCVASNAWTGAKGTSGMESTGNLTASKTYTITCTGPGGSANDSVTVNVQAITVFPPTVDIKANGSDGPITIPNNTSAILSWSSSNVDTCVASNGWSGSKAISGNESTGNLTNSKTYTITCTGAGGTANDSVTVNVESAPLAPTVDIKANGSDGPITILINTAATLSWTSANANNCVASNGWTGAKSTSGSESTGNLDKSKVFVITCSGAGGTATDSVTVDVQAPLQGNLIVQKTASNISDGTSLSEQTAADPGETILFSIQVGATVAQLQNIIVKDVLPAQMKLKGNLKVDNVVTSGDITSGIGINIGTLSSGQIKTITFEAEILGADKFVFGDTKLINSAVVSAAGSSAVDTAQVTVTKKAVAGSVTDVSTGLTNNPILDSFFLPLLASLAGIWVLKSKIFRFEEWRYGRMKDYNKFRAEKVLAAKIAKIRAKEFLQKRIA